jgi:hypothetical protein
MECPFCDKKVELIQRIRRKKVCKKCERGVKVGIIVANIMFEELKNPQIRQKFVPTRTRVIKSKMKIVKRR